MHSIIFYWRVGYYLPEDLNLLEDNASLVLNMAILNCTLLNFSDKDLFLLIFEDYLDEFEYTADGLTLKTIKDKYKVRVDILTW